MSGNWISHVTEMQKTLRTVVIYSIFWMQKIATSDRGQRGWIKWRNCGCISAMWLDTWSSGHRPSDNQFWSDLDKAKSSKANSMHSGEFIQDVRQWFKDKVGWCMTTILDYFGLFRIISIWNRDSHLHEAVGGGHHLQAVDGFPKYLSIAKTFWFWELAVTTLLSVRSMPTCQGEVGTN